MIPYAFQYTRAQSLEEAQARLTAAPDAKILAGGQTLIATMKMRLASPSELIDISGLKDLAFLRVERGGVRIGAATTHAEVAQSAELRRALPALGELAQLIGDPAVRHLGTLGGSLANNDPAADYPAAAVALGATIKTTAREIAAEDFFTGMFSTALDEQEIVTEAFFPLAARAGYAKFRNPASRYAMAGVFVAQSDAGVRVAVTGAGPCVFRQAQMEAALTRDFSPNALAGIVVDPTNLNADLHGSADYRAHLVAVMARRAVAAALR